MSTAPLNSSYLTAAAPRVMVVDGSKVVRTLIQQMLVAQMPGVVVVTCGSGAEAQQQIAQGAVDLVTMSLRLPDMDGLVLAHYLRHEAGLAYIPIVIVSGDVQGRLERREFSDDVTDYFDKSLGFQALTEFIRGYVQPKTRVSGDVLYVEDSRVVALAVRRMLEKHGLRVHHVTSAESAVDWLETARSEREAPGVDIVLTDVNLLGAMTGGELLTLIRTHFGYAKGMLPVLVMTGDDNPQAHAVLIRAGANDLVVKPIEEQRLLTKLLFQMRVSQHQRAKV